MRLGALLVLSALAPVAAAQPAPNDAYPDAYPRAAAAYLVAVNGRVIWERAADVPRAPASLTKIMTAIVLIDGGFDPAAVVGISRRAAAIGGAQLGLRAGQTMTAGDLFTAMLVRSANDACTALAEHGARTVEAFVARMNERAAGMGLAATHFANPCGLDAPRHQSSARDLFRLTEAALTLPLFTQTVALERARVRVVGGPVFALDSSNALLGRVPGVFGVKTGFTSAAGHSVIAAADRGDTRVVAVLLDSPDRWWTMAALIGKAFDTGGTPR